MTDVTASPRHASGLAATIAHARYVLSDNPVTAFAFGLFALIVLAALFGPYIVPYDPFASNTAMLAHTVRACSANSSGTEPSAATGTIPAVCSHRVGASVSTASA